MRGFSVSRLLSAAAVLAVAAVCAGVGSAQPERPPQPILTQASGDLRLSNSQDGQAIFHAAGLAPGRSVTGTVTLLNSGTLPGDLTLQQLDVSDQPGVHGGRLSTVVNLDIKDVSGGSAIPIFAGRLSGLAARPLGAIGPGEARTFRFTASLPDGGLPPGPSAGDNAFAGSGVTVRYVWTATAAGGGPTPSQVPVVKVKLDSKRLLRRHIIDVTASCDIACRISAFAQLPKTKPARRAMKTRTHTVTLVVPNRAARIRLKVSRKARRQLARVMQKKHRAVVKVRLTVTAASGGTPTTYVRKSVVKGSKLRR